MTFDEKDFDRESQRLEAMSPEALTLHLARQGISPEDTRQSVAKIMQQLREWEKREAFEQYVEELTVEQELGLRR